MGRGSFLLPLTGYFALCVLLLCDIIVTVLFYLLFKAEVARV